MDERAGLGERAHYSDKPGGIERRECVSNADPTIDCSTPYVTSTNIGSPQQG